MKYRILVILIFLIFTCVCPITCQYPGPYHKPIVNLSIDMCTKDSTQLFCTEFYRGEVINISYSIKGDDGCEIENIDGMIYIPQYINITEKPNVNKYIYNDEYRIIAFNRDVRQNGTEDCYYTGIISLDAEPGSYDLVKDTIGVWNWRRRGDLKINGTNNLIHIKNNKPEIGSANVIILDDVSCLPCHDVNKLIYKSIGNPTKLSLVVSAVDKEKEPLNYNWNINDVSKFSTYVNTTICETFDASKENHICVFNATNLTSGRNYSFFVSASDTMNRSEMFKANIFYKDNVYDIIYIPLSHPTVPIFFYTAIILVLCIIGVNRDNLYNIYQRNVAKRSGPLSSSYVDEVILLVVILSVTCLYLLTYFYGYEYISPFNKSGELELMVYLKSLSLFEIYVYLVVFFVVVYFTEACFGQELTSSSERTRTGLLSNISNSIKLVTVSKLWIINSIFMLVVLLSLDAVILKVNSLDAFDTQSWLANYYGEMAEIFATILAIIAAFYTAIPRNVISARRGRDGKEDKFHYVHTKILQYFLVLYGVIVALSIWGFSAGITVDFPPLVELNWENFFNLVSIGVFETTLLLVPPAISCLYELLRSILFTGNVTLSSDPPGAKIFVDGRDTRLVTPNGLMLPRGLHKISIKKKGYKDYEVLGEGKDGEVCINAGTEQEYVCAKLKNVPSSLRNRDKRRRRKHRERS